MRERTAFRKRRGLACRPAFLLIAAALFALAPAGWAGVDDLADMAEGSGIRAADIERAASLLGRRKVRALYRAGYRIMHDGRNCGPGAAGYAHAGWLEQVPVKRYGRSDGYTWRRKGHYICIDPDGPDVVGTIIHELAHAVHFQMERTRRMKKLRKEASDCYVSDYGKANEYEYVAEVAEAMIRGKAPKCARRAKRFLKKHLFR